MLGLPKIAPARDSRTISMNRCGVLKRHTRRTAWIVSLFRAGMKPVMNIVETGEDGGVEAPNVAGLLGAYRAMGLDLVNGTEGGDGFGNRTLEQLHRAGVLAGKASAAVA